MAATQRYSMYECPLVTGNFLWDKKRGSPPTSLNLVKPHALYFPDFGNLLKVGGCARRHRLAALLANAGRTGTVPSLAIGRPYRNRTAQLATAHGAHSIPRIGFVVFANYHLASFEKGRRHLRRRSCRHPPQKGISSSNSPASDVTAAVMSDFGALPVLSNAGTFTQPKRLCSYPPQRSLTTG